MLIPQLDGRVASDRQTLVQPRSDLARVADCTVSMLWRLASRTVDLVDQDGLRAGVLGHALDVDMDPLAQIWPIVRRQERLTLLAAQHAHDRDRLPIERRRPLRLLGQIAVDHSAVDEDVGGAVGVVARERRDERVAEAAVAELRAEQHLARVVEDAADEHSAIRELGYRVDAGAVSRYAAASERT